jgi:hypothetical protein
MAKRAGSCQADKLASNITLLNQAIMTEDRTGIH